MTIATVLLVLLAADFAAGRWFLIEIVKKIVRAPK